jgi:hypothetical protein
MQNKLGSNVPQNKSFPQNNCSKLNQSTVNFPQNKGRFVDTRQESGPENGKN